MSLNANGFNLIELSENVWVFEAIEFESFTGTLREVITFAVRRYAFNVQEIEKALLEMVQMDHNAVHFGMWATFVYSFSQNAPRKQMVS